jgi:hypothetical protein
MNTAVFDGVFWSFVITSSIGCILAFSKMLYKSKCKSCRCCGCELIRDVEGEEKLDQLEIERHPGEFRSLSANADETKSNVI